MPKFTTDFTDPSAIPYFTWDHPMTVAELKDRIATASEPERYRLLGMILREARDTDVWHFTTPREVYAVWSKIEKHLGRRRAFWEFLFGKWRELALLDP